MPQGTEDPDASKKPRRSQRLSQPQSEVVQTTPVSRKRHLPSPITHEESTASSAGYKEGTATPPEGRPSQLHHRNLEQNRTVDLKGLSSPPPQDTQAFSQLIYPKTALSEDVKDEAEEGVWGYLVPLDQKHGKSLVLRKRNVCPAEDGAERTASGGYLIGRHPECGKWLVKRCRSLELNGYFRSYYR